MRRTWLAVLLCLLAAAPARGQEERPCRPRRHARLPYVKDLTYGAARRRLLAAGWKPLQTKPADDPLVNTGNGSLFRRRGYVELESCAGTGHADCSFLFKDRYGNRLRVTTEGEELPREGARAGVNGYRFVCD